MSQPVSLRERIARAICKAQGSRPDDCVHGAYSVAPEGALVMGECYRRAWQDYLAAADAVLEAMREPAPGMIGAMGVAQFKADLAQSPVRDAAISIYTAAVDAAIKEGKE